MLKAFGPDGKIYKFISVLFMLFKINGLWLATSGFPFLIAAFELADKYQSSIWLLVGLPIVMVGPATVAAHTIILKIIEETEGAIGIPYFKAYRDNLKLGIPLGLITLLGIWAVYMDVQLWLFSENSNISTLFLVFGIIAIFVLSMGLIYAYPLMARYENTLIGTIKNSFRIATRYFLRTLLCMVVAGGEVASILVLENLLNTITAYIIAAIIGPAVIMYSIASFAMIFFKEIEKKNENGDK